MTRAAYREAIEWASTTGVEVALECDVQFSADDQLVCLHDLTVDRTAKVQGRAIDLTVEQLKRLDFGPRTSPTASVEERADSHEDHELVTLAELMEMVADARTAGAPVRLTVETKHPNPRGADVELRVAEMLRERGWDRKDAPIQVMSFCPDAVQRLVMLLPCVERSLLIDTDLGEWRDGELPDGVRVVGPDLNLIKADPGFVARAAMRGHEVHVWTVNEPADIAFCRDLGVTGFTTDFPDRVAAELLAYSGAFRSEPPIA
jgi:glycerophosphoryl diester phosphodiesterase